MILQMDKTVVYFNPGVPQVENVVKKMKFPTRENWQIFSTFTLEKNG